MRLRTRVTCGTCLLVLAVLGVAGPAAATPSISIKAPASTTANTDVNLTYSGVAESDGTAEGAMVFHSFYEIGAAGCAPTVAAQRSRPAAKYDGQQYVSAPTPTPFSIESVLAFPSEGSFRVCVYLSKYPVDENAAPAATTEAVVQVGRGAGPCVVPNVRGLSLKTATNRLKVAGCVLGRVFKPSRVPKKRTLIVKSQSVKPDLMVASGSKVNVTMKLKPKR